ncbi:MAG: DUF2130 domain-containing protein [Verrucomicrobia bacterium]|nr:DUF2130 domain-containing protein [Verrucomicrobiota bacterium]
MSDTIICPHCQKEIQISEAMTHSLREGFQKEFAEKRNALEQELAKQRGEMEKQRTVIEIARRDLESQVQQRLGAEREKLKSAMKQEAAETVGVEMRDLRVQLEEKKRSLDEAQKQELALLKQKRDLEERAKAQELEIERKLAEERSKIQETARRQAHEEEQLRFAEKEKQIDGLRAQIEVLKQKAEQGSQQLQGEVQELQLEESLKQVFPFDEIAPVSTGARGADMLQKVRGMNGQVCGTIIWESKRTRTWSKGWLDKLKEDQRAQGAELAILVSQALPDDVTTFCQIDGVWVCSYALAIPLAAALRQQLSAVAATRRAESGKGEKMEALYQYVSSTAFQQQVESISKAFLEMQKDLSGERAAMERLWNKREKQIQRILQGNAALYGSIEGIVGHLTLPVRTLELDGGAEEE